MQERRKNMIVKREKEREFVMLSERINGNREKKTKIKET